MKIFDLPRAAGKTTTLAKMMQENADLIYVCPTMGQAQRVAFVISKRLDPNISSRRFMSAQAYLDQYGMGAGFSGDRPPIVVDELDRVLETLFQTKVVAGALTSEPL
jgi:hypothetical protein